MNKICSFKEYLMREDRADKLGLYPLGYSGIGLYPAADYLTHAADAILYFTLDDRVYHNADAAPFDISHLPGHPQYGDKVNSGENAPFDIRDIPGKVVPPKWKMPEGESVPFKQWLKLVQNPTTISPPDSPNLPD